MSVEVISHPPSSVRSGVALRSHYTIQHKSDILLQEQIERVKTTQEQLTKLITELEVTRGVQEVENVQRHLEEQRERAEYEVLKLQVAKKISVELTHTRADLDRALGGRGDIPACRRRVAWLEGRMERVINQQRSVSKPGGSSPLLQNDRSCPAAVGETQPPQKVTCPETSEKAEMTASDTPETVATMGLDELKYPGERTALSPQQEDGDIFLTAMPVSEDALVRSDGEEAADECTVDRDDKRLTHSAPPGQLSQGLQDPTTGHDDHTLRSSLTASQAVPSQKRRVMLQTEGHTPITADVVRSVDSDRASEYWSSEHHRFESNEISRALCDADPLSYHQMALAIPGSFLSRSMTDVGALPWRPHRKGSDIQDVHKIALNKLVGRLNAMSEKVYDAAMLSVKSNSKTELKDGESSLLHKHDQGGSRTSVDDSKESHDQSSEASLVLPKLQLKRLGTSESGRMVFYPNPIPPPKKLPLTRTNHEIEFPRLTSYFYDVTEDRHGPAQRIVDQHNLYDETRFTLYRGRPRSELDGLSVTEKRLRKLLETDAAKGTSAETRSSAKTIASQESSHVSPKLSPREISKKRRQKLKSHFAVAKAVAKLKANDRWAALKPKGNGMEHSGLKWERVKTLVHVNLVSERVDERIDAAKNLGVLRCGDAMVFFALKERLNSDPEKRVQYEAAKSLVLIGCWEDDVLKVILYYLVSGNMDIRTDLIRTMTEGKNLQYIDKRTVTFPELIKVLSHYCRNPDPTDMIAFDSAVLLGKMCVVDKHASGRLKAVLRENNDTHVKAKALEILIKQMSCTDWEIVEDLLELLRVSPVWKYRDQAAKLLILLGTQHVCGDGKTDKVYELLEKKLWDDPITEVRLSVAKTITALNMFPRASERVQKRLLDQDEKTRSQAVISLGTLGMKSEKVIRQLLEMIELDSSEYVRIMIVRTFATMKWADKRIVRVLREKERLDGVLATESKRALKTLCPDPLLKSKSTKT